MFQVGKGKHIVSFLMKNVFLKFAVIVFNLILKS